jgi:hypothetical protein
VALPRIGFNEGSLLRRTLLHVATFVLGSMAFIGIMSFVLVSIARGLVAPKGETASSEEDLPRAVASAGGKAATPAPLVRPPGGRTAGKRVTVPMNPSSRDD